MALERQNSTSKAVLMGDLMSLLSSLLFRRAKNQAGTYLTDFLFLFTYLFERGSYFVALADL